MRASETANTGPPSSSAVDVEAAMGTLTTVAARSVRRIRRPLPETALAAQVSSCQGSQSRPNSRAALPMPAQVGSWISRETSWEKAKT